MELSLKRGSGRTFSGSNWKSVSDSAWEIQVLFVPGHPSPKEKYQGNRKIDNIEFAVFQCLNDEYFAQPVSVCELPLPKDPCSMQVFYTLEAPVTTPEEKKKMTNSVQSTKVLQFSGKNWKLASDKKWKPVSSFSTFEDSAKVGEKTIKEVSYSIYRTPDGFAAVKLGE